MKTETCKHYLGAFWIFLPNVIKIDPHNFELCGFKVGAFFLRHSVLESRANNKGQSSLAKCNIAQAVVDITSYHGRHLQFDRNGNGAI